jgi:hypothetical protein
VAMKDLTILKWDSLDRYPYLAITMKKVYKPIRHKDPHVVKSWPLMTLGFTQLNLIYQSNLCWSTFSAFSIHS